MIENKIMDIMDKIEYGFMDGDGLNIIENNLEKWDNDFFDFYYLLAPE